MPVYLIPLGLSFGFNLASAFTLAYSRRWGRRGGQLISAVLRNLLGLPALGIAFALAALTPAPRLLAPSLGLEASGWILMGLGTALIVGALWSIRRPAAAPAADDALVQQGLYAHVRHPLYDGVLCELAGAALARPTWPILVCSLLSAGWVVAQALAEEHDLKQRLPGYRAYMAQVPRFLPRLGRRRA